MGTSGGGGFHGVFPYLVSPIAPDGAVLDEALRRLVDHLVACGVPAGRA